MANEAPKRYPVDALHAGIRLTVTFVFFGATALALFVIMPPISQLFQLTGILSALVYVGGSAGIAIGSALLIDRVLRKLWPSGRWITVKDSSISFHEKDGTETNIPLGLGLEIIVWHFVIQQNRTWVPRGWHCVACQLTRGETRITPYAFVKPEQAALFPRWNGFQQVVPRKELVANDGELPDTQIKLRLAERTRWESGLEMYADDFQQLLKTLDNEVAVWSSAKLSQ